MISRFGFSCSIVLILSLTVLTRCHSNNSTDGNAETTSSSESSASESKGNYDVFECIKQIGN